MINELSEDLLKTFERSEKNKEKADLEIGKQKYKADVLPPALIVRRYFQAEQAATNAEVKAQKSALDRLVFVKYSELIEAEIKRLVIDDKWMNALERMINEEIGRLWNRLTTRTKTLAAR